MAPRRTAQVAITALLLLGCAYVLSPFFAAILFAGTVVITSWPLYARLHAYLRGSVLAQAMIDQPNYPGVAECLAHN